MAPVLVSVTIAVMKHYDQSNLGRKGFIWLHFHIVVHHSRKSGQELKQGRNLEAGADAEAMEAFCLLACSPWLLQPALTQNHLPEMAPPTMVWVLPHQSLDKNITYWLAYSLILLRYFLN